MSNTCCSSHSLAMATVPVQKWCAPYDWKTALEKGTVFPCLNLDFFKSEENVTPIGNSALNAQETALNEISAIGFAINDLTLYLDTHPDCPEGTKLFKELLQKRLELLADYAAKYQPLTQLSMVTGEPESTTYDWAEGPLPWEGGHI